MDSSSELLPSYDSCIACGLPILFFPELSAHPIKKNTANKSPSVPNSSSISQEFSIHVQSTFINFRSSFNRFSTTFPSTLPSFSINFHSIFHQTNQLPAIFQPFSSHFPAIFHQVFLQGSLRPPPQDALEILRKAPKPSASQELRALQLLSQAEKLLTNRCWC